MKINEVLRKIGLTLSAAIIASVAVTGCSSNQAQQTDSTKNAAAATPSVKTEEVTSESALKELVEGNKRFTSGKLSTKDFSPAVLEDLSKNGQHPFATVITCSDSRVSPELIFDQGLGKVFVIRDAGNVTGSIESGSAEYGAEHLKTPLLVVLGHSHCGAVKASVEGAEVTPNIESIVEKIVPSIEAVKSSNKGVKEGDLAALVENKNVNNTIADLMKSPTIKHLVDAGELKIVAAKYNIETGAVEFQK